VLIIALHSLADMNWEMSMETKTWTEAESKTTAK
jgi:hypothetical protein